MTLRALVIDDDPAIVEEVVETLASLGHEFETAGCMESARAHIAVGGFDYVLLDLEIPVGTGSRFPRIQNGKHLLREIRSSPTTARTPVIVMTGYGNDGPYQAVDVLRIGAVHYVTKPFGLRGLSLDDAIMAVIPLDVNGNKMNKQTEELPRGFEGGEMVFSDDRVELYEVKICGGAKSGRIRRILDELGQKKSSGLFVAYSGTELAKRIKCPAGETGVSGAIREFRKKTSILFLEEANIKCGPRDIIQSGGRGYRLTEKITVVKGNDPVRDPVNDPDAPDPDPVYDPVNEQQDHRQEWILSQLRDHHPLHRCEIESKFRCSDSTATRLLKGLIKSGLIKFVGPAKTGHYELKKPVQAESRTI